MVFKYYSEHNHAADGAAYVETSKVRVLVLPGSSPGEPPFFGTS